MTKKRGLKIIMKAFPGSEGTIFIPVEDNGVGIVKEALEKIFIPFFTTKEKGFGIGLSRSPCTVRMYRGTIKVKSTVDEGSIFTLRIG